MSTLSEIIRSRSESAPRSRRGQTVVEFALVLPLFLFLFLAIFDFGRLFAAALTVESAAREAADFGSLYRWHWSTSPIDNVATTEAEMERRACTAASTLVDYEEPSGTVNHETCTNPAFTYDLIEPPGVIDCSTIPREDEPCMVRVTLDHNFGVILPLSLTFFDTTLGLPSEVPFTRTSTFAVSDFQIDIEPAP
jgi:Flp pilus assembly protein TadG